VAALRLDLGGLAQHLGGLAAKVLPDDWSPALRTLSVLLTADTRGRFQSGTGPAGAAWLPLKRPRPNSRGADKPLLDTGVLAASWGSVSDVGPTRLAWGSDLDRAAWQNFGTRTIPARVQMGFSEAFLAKSKLVLADFLAKWWAGQAGG
jgi:hypothetical protein